jgi:hypothetical protein
VKTTLKTLSLFLLLGAGVAFAADKSTDAMAQTKAMAMKERSAMMEQAKTADTQAADAMKMAKGLDGDKARALEAQIADLQKTVKALNTQLAKVPKYFDDPTADALRP